MAIFGTPVELTWNTLGTVKDAAGMLDRRLPGGVFRIPLTPRILKCRPPGAKRFFIEYDDGV